LRLPERKAAVDHIGQTKAKNVRGKLAELEIHAFTGNRGKIHFEKVSHKFPVDVVELEPVRVGLIFGPVFRGKCCKGVLVELAVLADTLVDEKPLAVFDPCKRVAAVRALKQKLGGRLALEKVVAAHLAQKLAAPAIVVVDIRVRSTAVWAYYARLRTSGATPGYRLERLTEKVLVLSE
jgi:hypothetical protein